jgi:hypothetical protein
VIPFRRAATSTKAGGAWRRQRWRILDGDSGPITEVQVCPSARRQPKNRPNSPSTPQRRLQSHPSRSKSPHPGLLSFSSDDEYNMKR